MLDLKATIADHSPLKFSVGISSLATFRPTEAPFDPSIGNGFFMLQQANFAVGMAMFT